MTKTVYLKEKGRNEEVHSNHTGILLPVLQAGLKTPRFLETLRKILRTTQFLWFCFLSVGKESGLPGRFQSIFKAKFLWCGFPLQHFAAGQLTARAKADPHAPTWTPCSCPALFMGPSWGLRVAPDPQRHYCSVHSIAPHPHLLHQDLPAAISPRGSRSGLPSIGCNRL